MPLAADEARALNDHFTRIVDDTARARRWADSAQVAALQAGLAGKAPSVHPHVWADITGGTAAVTAALTGVFDAAGSATAAETAAKQYADTIAFGNELAATDAAVAGLATDPGTELGAVMAGKQDRGELTLNVLDFGADRTGATPSHAAFNAAINAAVGTFGIGGTVYVPAGVYTIAASVLLKSRATIVGAGLSSVVVRAASGITTAMFLGTSGNTVQDAHITGISLDGSSASLTNTLQGVQVTNGARITVTRSRIFDMTGGGVQFTNTPDSTVEGCVIDNTGSITVMHSVQFTAGSHRGKARGNRITNSRGSAVWVGDAGNGCADCEVSGNYIDMIESSASMEGIGVTPNSPRAIIIGNHVMNSKDNGISITSPEAIVMGNIIEFAWAAGIGMGGPHSIVVGNRIRNCGQDMTEQWGGIGLGASDCVIVGNVIYDDQPDHTMSYGVKEFANGNGNVILGNRIYGFLLSEFLRVGPQTVAFVGTRPTISGSKGGNTALASLVTALSTAGLILDQTT